MFTKETPYILRRWLLLMRIPIPSPITGPQFYLTNIISLPVGSLVLTYPTRSTTYKTSGVATSDKKDRYFSGKVSTLYSTKPWSCHSRFSKPGFFTNVTSALHLDRESVHSPTSELTEAIKLSSWPNWLQDRQSGDRIPGGGKIFRTCPHRPWGPPSLLYNGYRVFPGGEVAGAWR